MEETKLNNELTNHIKQKLNLLAIDFNLGLIMSLSIKEKKELKEMIDSIDRKNNEQELNNEKVK